MAVDFEIPPIYDELINRIDPIHMSDIWIGYWTYFYQTLIGYLSSFGIFLPQLTTDQRDSIQVPGDGQFIYNTDIHAPQFWQSSSSSWRTISFT